MGEPDARGRPGTILDVIGAAMAALLAFTAVPAVLVFVVGNPLSGGLGHAWRPAPRDALCLLALAAWIAWAACCTQLVRAVVAHVRNRDLAAHGSPSLVDRVAVRIAVGVLALTSLGAPVALSSAAGAHTVSASPPPTGARGHRATGRRVHTPPLLPSGALYDVLPGDTLWSLADEIFDDGADWTALASLNLGRPMPAGNAIRRSGSHRSGLAPLPRRRWRWRAPSNDEAEGHRCSDGHRPQWDRGPPA